MTHQNQGPCAPAAARQRGSVPLLLERSALMPTLAVASADANLEATGQRQRIRVLVVSARFLPDLGGVETHIHEITRRMAKYGDLDLTVLTTDRSGTLPVREEFDGFTVVRCRSYPRHRDYYFAPRLHRLILGGHYDLVHCQGIHTAVPVLAMLAARRSRIPYVVTFHTGGHSSGLRQRLRNTQWRALGPLLRGATAVVAVSRFEQQLFEKACCLDASRFRIVRNGGDLPATAEQVMGIPGRIVSSGRLERYKGHQRVIEALPIVQRSIPDATLHILGSGPYEGKLRVLIGILGLEKSVTIECIAPDDRARMAESLGAAAVFAALSEYEAHPVAVMEALMLGIPIVGLDTAGIGELVEDGLIRGVPKDASPTTVAQTLITALKDRPASGSATLPTWDSAAADLAHIYKDAVRAGPKPLRSYDGAET
jgi:glycosyltransferase involved in cell wall biosynthesis